MLRRSRVSRRSGILTRSSVAQSLARDGEQLTSMSHGLSCSSRRRSKPKSSKQDGMVGTAGTATRRVRIMALQMRAQAMSKGMFCVRHHTRS
jgi:hypothetical protein